MSDLQARLAKLRASNQTIKAVADRIDSAKVLASGVMDELDDVIEALPAEAHPPAPVQAVVLDPIVTDSVVETVELDEPTPVFVKDVPPLVAGALPETLDMEEEPPEAEEPEAPVAEPQKVRREGGG